MPEHRPDTRVTFDATMRPMVTPEEMRRTQIASVQAWLDSLDRAPTAEEILVFAEAFCS